MTLARAASIWHLEPGKAHDRTHGGGSRSLLSCDGKGLKSEDFAWMHVRVIARANARAPLLSLAHYGGGWRAAMDWSHEPYFGKPRYQCATSGVELYRGRDREGLH